MISDAQRILADNLMTDARAMLGTPAAIGDRKVFLAALLGPVAGQDMSELDELRRAGLLTFERADFVPAMDAELVAASEWVLPVGATYHFLVVD